MIISPQSTFSVAQSIVSGVGDVVSTDVYDTGANADAGIGEETTLHAQIRTAAVGPGASVQLVVQTDDNVGFASPKEFLLTTPIPVASLTANYLFDQRRLPPGLERFLRVVYRISGASISAGTVAAFLVKDAQASRAHPTTVPSIKL